MKIPTQFVLCAFIALLFTPDGIFSASYAAESQAHIHGTAPAPVSQSNDSAVKREGWSDPVGDSMPFLYILGDQLEYRLNDGEDTVRWDITGWYGGDYNKIWFKTEGEHLPSNGAGESENQLLYSRLITPFWDAQIGLRYDETWGRAADPSRAFAVIGLEGFAPYRFEVEPAFFISEDGDVSAKFTASADLFLTQRLILQPRLDTEFAAQDAERFAVASGFNNVELGLRLRYEIRHRFAPYIGIHWKRVTGETADLLRRAGEDDETLGFVAGLRLWF